MNLEAVTLHDLIDFAARWVLYFSLASIFLPPIEFFDDYPRVQKGYRLVCKLIKFFGSLDLRGKVISMYPSYQKSNGNGKSNGEVK